MVDYQIYVFSISAQDLVFILAASSGDSGEWYDFLFVPEGAAKNSTASSSDSCGLGSDR